MKKEDNIRLQEPTTKDYFFVYGSLRKGEYNHYLIQNCSDFKGMAEVKGFKLISLGSYPCITKSDNPDDKVIGELYKINHKEAIHRIDSMELNVGYKRERRIVSIKNESGDMATRREVLFYVIDDVAPFYLENNVVEHGDWVKYLKDKKKGVKNVS